MPYDSRFDYYSTVHMCSLILNVLSMNFWNKNSPWRQFINTHKKIPKLGKRWKDDSCPFKVIPRPSSNRTALGLSDSLDLYALIVHY